jgi:hypothetical protein
MRKLMLSLCFVLLLCGCTNGITRIGTDHINWDQPLPGGVMFSDTGVDMSMSNITNVHNPSTNYDIYIWKTAFGFTVAQWDSGSFVCLPSTDASYVFNSSSSALALLGGGSILIMDDLTVNSPCNASVSNLWVTIADGKTVTAGSAMSSVFVIDPVGNGASITFSGISGGKINCANKAKNGILVTGHYLDNYSAWLQFVDNDIWFATEAAMSLNSSNLLLIDNLFTYQCGDGIDLEEGCVNVIIDNPLIFNSVHTGIYVCTTYPQPHHPCEGVIIKTPIIIGGETALCSFGCFSLTVIGNMFDQQTHNAVILDGYNNQVWIAAGGYISPIGCITTDDGACGIYINGNASFISISEQRISDCGYYGIRTFVDNTGESITSIQISGCTFAANNRLNAGGGDIFTGNDNSDIIITNNILYTDAITYAGSTDCTFIGNRYRGTIYNTPEIFEHNSIIP